MCMSYFLHFFVLRRKRRYRVSPSILFCIALRNSQFLITLYTTWRSSLRCLWFSPKWSALFGWTFFERQFLVPVWFLGQNLPLLFLFGTSPRCHVSISVRFINHPFWLNTSPSGPLIFVEYFFFEIITYFILCRDTLNNLILFSILMMMLMLMMVVMAMTPFALLIVITIWFFVMMMMFMMLFASMTMPLFFRTLQTLISLTMVGMGVTAVVTFAPSWRILVNREAIVMSCWMTVVTVMFMPVAVKSSNSLRCRLHFLHCLIKQLFLSFFLKHTLLVESEQEESSNWKNCSYN